jgi:translation initiation factor 2 subunit 3
MLSNIRLMNGVIIVVSANEDIETKPQLIQHLAAVKLSGIKNIIICFNKIDLVNNEKASRNYQKLKDWLIKYDIMPTNESGIIPTSFSNNDGIEWLLEEIVRTFPTSNISRSTELDPYFLINRNFDVNKPGTDFNDVIGAVIGGTLINGILNDGDEVIIKPGITLENKNGYIPFKTKIQRIETSNKEIKTIIPGGLIGIGTDIDPKWTKNDPDHPDLTGCILGSPDRLPNVYTSGIIEFEVTPDFGYTWKPEENEEINLQIETLFLKNCLIKSITGNQITINFVNGNRLNKYPCIEINTKIVFTKVIDNSTKVVAFGEFKNGEEAIDLTPELK